MLVSTCPVLLISSKLTYFMSMDSQGLHLRKVSKSYVLLYILDINVTVLFWWIKKFFIMGDLPLLSRASGAALISKIDTV